MSVFVKVQWFEMSVFVNVQWFEMSVFVNNRKHGKESL